MRIGITGGSGFLGSALREEAKSRGHVGFPLPLPRDDSLRDRTWLGTWPDLESLDLLIHAAASVRPITGLDLYLNAEFPRVLQCVFHERNPSGLLIYISTINVLVDALVDAYTASKRVAEATINRERTLIVRPSLIWSAPDRGPARKLRDFLLKMPLSVMTYPGNRHRPVRVEDLAKTIIALGESGREHGVINIYGDTPYTLWQISKELAHQHHRFLLPVPVPFASRHLPKLLRSLDYTRLSTSWEPCADQTIVLPFSLGGGSG
jgi:nucleoside-diphosphate-sugar epimerase